MDNATELNFNLPELIDIHVSEDDFAKDELKRGKILHKHDGIWWTEKVKFYYGPLNKMRIFTPKEVAPNFFKALLGYSYRVKEQTENGHDIIYNILQGESLREYNIKKIPSPKRSQVRQGLNNCHVKVIKDIAPYLLEMKSININQALRFDNMGAKKDYLPATYYEEQEEKWRKNMLDNFSHTGHFMIGAFVGEKLAAFIDLIIIEDTWEFGAVKSHDDYLPFRTVDALYYHILHTASLNSRCKYVINGGAKDERESLTKFKMKLLIQPTLIHNYTCSIVPSRLLAIIKQLIK
jgi:hypothetical protein